MPSGVPPGPRDWTFGFSELRKMQRDILAYWTDLHRRYGDVVYIRIGPYRSYTFFHPDAIRETIVAKAKQFRRFPKPMQVLAQWNGNSLIITEGEEWLRQRRMVQPAFHPKRFDRYAACMVDRTRNLLDRWLTRIKDETSIEVEIDRAMTDLTLDIICKTMFDAQIDAETSDVGRAVAILSEVSVKEMKSLCSFPDWLPLPGKRRKRWAMQRLDETVRRFIRERRASGEDRGDLLSMLLLAVDEEGNGGQLTDEQVRDQSMTLLIAGHDTTAAGLTWTLYCLARYPRIAAHVQQELDAVLVGRTPVAGDLPQLSLTERVVKETLRLYPPGVGLLVRQALTDVEVGGYAVPRHGLVQIYPYVCHHDPRWFPEPHTFDPGRFLPERQQKLPPFAYFPFGGGPRVCIGNTFAMMEMTLVVATLLQSLDVEPAIGQGEAEPVPRMSLRPKEGVRLRWTGRPTAHFAPARKGLSRMQETRPPGSQGGDPR